MKYIDADRLIAYLEEEADIEFKKTEENANSPVLCHFHNGCRMMALETIDFIKQHQQEQPEVDLEEEMEKELRSHYNDDQDVYWWNYLKNSFRLFYELGLNARKEEK